MRCPVCKVDMVVLEFEQVEIDYCFECRGVWLDGGELDAIGRRAGALRNELLAALETAAAQPTPGRGKRRCPVCRKTLARATTPGDRPVVLDRCERGHGLWFDRGELAAVVRLAGADKENVLAQFFRDLEDQTDAAEPPSA